MDQFTLSVYTDGGLGGEDPVLLYTLQMMYSSTTTKMLYT
jgi:hypothetical protein